MYAHELLWIQTKCVCAKGNKQDHQETNATYDGLIEKKDVKEKD